MVNKGFLFATSSRKIKSHVVESQITLLVWPCLNHLQKNIAQLITWSFLMIQSVSFTSAAFEAFAEAYLCFFSICLDRKNAEAIKFPGILKINVSKNKIYFCLKKKSNVSLNKKVICLSHNFQTWFYNADHLLYYPQMSVFSFHTFFVPLYQILRKRT